MTKIWTKILLQILVFVTISLGAKAQPIDLVPYSRSVQTPDSLSHAEALSLFQKSNEVIEGVTTFGLSQNYFWILINPPLGNLDEQFVLDVDNPHIDRIAAYRISNGKFTYLGNLVIAFYSIKELKKTEETYSMCVLRELRIRCLLWQISEMLRCRFQ